MSVSFQLSSLVRAVGPAAAVGLSTPRRSHTTVKAVALGATDVVARRIDKRGITLLSITPDEGKTFTSAQQLGNEAMTASAWVGLWLLLTKATDRLALPCAAKVVGIGATVYALDAISAQMYANLLRKSEEAKAGRTAGLAGSPETTDASGTNSDGHRDL